MFKEALPLWPEGLRDQMNIQVLFSAEFTPNASMGPHGIELRIAGATFFRIFLNGKFVHHGPARAPHGYVRMDRVPLDRFVRQGENLLRIESAGYNCPCFYGTAIPSFLQFEVEQGERILLSTGLSNGVSCRRMKEREQLSLRYSYQRHFSEVYHFSSGGETQLREALHNCTIIERKVPIPEYRIRRGKAVFGPGRVRKRMTIPNLSSVRYISEAGKKLPGFPRAKIRSNPLEMIQNYTFSIEELRQTMLPTDMSTDMSTVLKAGEYLIIDMGTNVTGFIGSRMEAFEESEVLLLFDEKLIARELRPETWESVNIVSYTLEMKGLFSHLSYEAYGFRYLFFYVERGRVRIVDLFLREYVYPLKLELIPATKDEELLSIYEAAKRSFRQSTLDVFMDCPTRERAGWLCDSYFTAIAAVHFTGDTVVEQEMMEDYLRGSIGGIPEGMVPMCYPADSPRGEFIPQWGMWFILQLRDYFMRNPRAEPEAYRELCMGLVGFFEKFENSLGLLEGLPGWNFVDWSEANEWTGEVNFPTNMLYSEILGFLGKCYGVDRLLTKSTGLRRTIIEWSWDGEFFHDQARRDKDGLLLRRGNRSETCQYYSLAFGIANEEWSEYSRLKKRVLEDLGPSIHGIWEGDFGAGTSPGRGEKEGRPVPAGLLTGNLLRLELLFRWGEYRRLIEEIRLLFGKQANLTGTLWEHGDLRGSLNHGFGSYVGYLLYESLLAV